MDKILPRGIYLSTWERPITARLNYKDKTELRRDYQTGTDTSFFINGIANLKLNFREIKNY